MIINRLISGKWSSLLLIGLLTAGMASLPGYTASAATSFSDVEAGAYYEDAVNWAVENGVTNGTAEGIFSPDADCTRAQMVTFLYNAFGDSAASSSAAFLDVSKSSYYCNAVNWAVAKGITTGVSRTHFDPDGKCTRAQAVTFISRLFSIDDIDLSSAGSFNDVSKGDYYYDAVKWAVREGIAKGTGNGEFSPSVTCSRAQIMTFLYRFDQMQMKAGELLKVNNLEDLISKYGSVMEESLFYNANGGNARLFDAYFSSKRYIWNVNGQQVLIRDSDETYYGGEMDTDGSTQSFKIVFGNTATKQSFDWAMSMENGMIRLLDREVLVKDIFDDGGDTVLVIENPDISRDYLNYVDSSYRGDVALVATFRFSGTNGGRLTGMTADYRLGNGRTLKAMKTSVFYGNESDTEDILIGERTFTDADEIKASLKGSDKRNLKWTINPGTDSESVIEDSVPKGVGFYCALQGSTGIYLDAGLTQKLDKDQVDVNSDLTVYSGTKQ